MYCLYKTIVNTRKWIGYIEKHLILSTSACHIIVSFSVRNTAELPSSRKNGGFAPNPGALPARLRCRRPSPKVSIGSYIGLLYSKTNSPGSSPDVVSLLLSCGWHTLTMLGCTRRVTLWFGEHVIRNLEIICYRTTNWHTLKLSLIFIVRNGDHMAFHWCILTPSSLVLCDTFQGQHFPCSTVFQRVIYIVLFYIIPYVSCLNVFV